VLPTILIFSHILSSLSGLDSKALRQELDAQPWRPAPGSTAPVAAPTVVAPTAAPQAAEPPVVAPVRAARADTPATPAGAPPTASGSFRWRIQLAALGTSEQAQREQIRLEKALGAGSITIAEDGGKFKLRWGNFTSREAAETARADLKARQIDGFTVRTSP